MPQCFVTHLDATLVEELLNVSLVEGEAVIEPLGVADDAQGETVAVRLTVRHSASPNSP